MIGREKLNAVRAEIRAIEKVGLAQEVHQQKLHEAQEIAEAVLDAEMRIGELTAKIPTASGGDRRSENFKSNNGDTFENTKSKQLSNIGMTKIQASRYEVMAKHPEAVEKAKARAREEGRIATRQDALNEIHDMTWGETKSPRQLHKEIIETAKQEREEFEEKKAEGIVSIKDVAQDKENAKMLAMELWSRLAKMGNGITEMYVSIKEGDVDIDEMISVMSKSEVASLISRIGMWQSQLTMILKEITD